MEKQTDKEIGCQAYKQGDEGIDREKEVCMEM